MDDPGLGEDTTAAAKTTRGQAAKALEILEWIAAYQGPAPRLTEIALGTNVPKATVHRMLAVLRERGYVVQDEHTGYSLGLTCFELGQHWMRRFDLRGVARPHLERLNRDLEETVQLGVYDQGDVVYVDKIESPQRVLARPDPSNRAPATAVATGRALLAYQSASELEVQLSRPLPRYTELTPRSRADVLTLLDEVRVVGYAVNQETYRDGICGLAAPIRDSTGAVIAAIGIIVPAHRFTSDNFDVQRARVIDAAVAISAALGGPDGLVTARRAEK